MGVALVCTANAGTRFSCNSRCHHCRFLIPDRRRQQINSYRYYFRDRRCLNDWIPHSVRLAGAGIQRPFVLKPAVERSSFEVMPLILAIALMLFNLLDAILTTRALSMGIVEANPLMAELFSISLPAGMLLKSLLVAAGALLLWWYCRLPLARRGMAVLTCFYGAVVAYHLFFQLALSE